MCATAPPVREQSFSVACHTAWHALRARPRFDDGSSLRLSPWLLLLVVLGAAPPAWAITTPPSWEPRVLIADSLGNPNQHTGADRALAFDHYGNPGFAFFDGASGDLRYATRAAGLGWVHTVVDSVGNVGHYPSLAYDRYERPAISYFDTSPNLDLKYAHFDGSLWQIETVDSTNSVGWYSSLAFDRLGRPAIAYYDQTNFRLRYVSDTDGDFSLADEFPITVANGLFDGNYASLVFDPLNRPMIAHSGGATANLRFTTMVPGLGWLTTTVDEGLDAAYYPSIDIDPDNGYPAIAYFNDDVDDLRYAAWDGDEWILTTIDSAGDQGRFPSLAFDPADGNPAISYLDNEGGDLKLAWHDGDSWQIQTVDAVDNVGIMSSLAFNDYGTGFPSIAYFPQELIPTSIYYIEDPPAAVPEPGTLALTILPLATLLLWNRRGRRGRRENLQME